MEKNKMIAEMYWVLKLIQAEYEANNEIETFYHYAKRRTSWLYEQAFNWLVDDERESLEKIAQD